MNIRIIYEDEISLVADKPAGIETIGVPVKLGKKIFNAHRLDKDTSGVNLFAKDQETLIFFQKQFFTQSGSSQGLEKKLEKRYIALVVGSVKDNEGKIETLIGRNPKERKKQKVYLETEPGSDDKRRAITEYRVLERIKSDSKKIDYTLLQVHLKTGRKHQIRCHMAYLHHPVAGDKLYGFKNQLNPKELKRQFLHAEYIKIKYPSGEYKEFCSKLPEDLQLCLTQQKNLAKNI